MRRRPAVVSFSGIDGAGKSTQIEALRQFLAEHGYRLKLCTFWDDVVAFAGFREKCSIRLFKGDKGIGSPERPIQRRDKNVKSWPMLLLRLLLYTADALRLRTKLTRHIEAVDLVIFDRYIYDEWANLPLHHGAIRIYISLVTNLVIKPDVAILLDAEPSAAYQRKPEYPLEFVRRNRETYLHLAQMVGMTTIFPQPVGKATESVLEAVAPLLRCASKRSISSESCVAEPENQPAQRDESPFLSTTSSH